MRRILSNGPAPLLVLLLLGPALAGCMGEEPAATAATPGPASTSPAAPTPEAPAETSPEVAPAPAAPPPNATAAAPRVVSHSGSFLAAVGNPIAIGPQPVPQTQVQGSEPLMAEAVEGEIRIVVDFYYRSAPFSTVFRVVDPDGEEQIVTQGEGDLPPDPMATHHVQERFDAKPGAWTFAPHVYQARVQGEWTFVVSFFREEPALDYYAEPPA